MLSFLSRENRLQSFRFDSDGLLYCTVFRCLWESFLFRSCFSCFFLTRDFCLYLSVLFYYEIKIFFVRVSFVSTFVGSDRHSVGPQTVAISLWGQLSVYEKRFSRSTHTRVHCHINLNTGTKSCAIIWFPAQTFFFPTVFFILWCFSRQVNPIDLQFARKGV